KLEKEKKMEKRVKSMKKTETEALDKNEMKKEVEEEEKAEKAKTLEETEEKGNLEEKRNLDPMEPEKEEKEENAGSEEPKEDKSKTQKEEIPLFSMRRRLTKSRKNKILTGVCGGIGEYFDIDPTLVRLAFVLLAFFNGMGIVIYIILAVIMPEENFVEMGKEGVEGERESFGKTKTEEKSDRMRLLGAIFLITGIFLFLDKFRVFEHFWWVDRFFWPAVFTAAGIWLLLRNRE
ncbi:MAG: PspC domain-containing protein, partial [Methanosarcinaceae archaeon]|nr:PspC domain-containing protein [Methanosarcinaceae archaeon]